MTSDSPHIGSTDLKTAPNTVLDTVQWKDGAVRMLDQTLLPLEVVYKDFRTVEEVWEAIRSLRVRGAPAIGVAAAFGVLLSVWRESSDRVDVLRKKLEEDADYLATSRPTAVNLFWALDRMRRVGREASGLTGHEWRLRLLDEAQAVLREDLELCRSIGRHGAELIKDGDGVLTHCNAGGLATSGYGTALGVLFAAHEQGRPIHVYADETRPLLQGARLTAWELMRAGIETTLICDSVAARVLDEGRIQIVIVGADRIAANGDTANKIGTYGVAVLAHAHGVPFYVAAPSSTLDFSCETGVAIAIEERPASEVTEGFGRRTAPEGVNVYAPAFDVTPAALIKGIITEEGVHKPPYVDSLPR